MVQVKLRVGGSITAGANEIELGKCVALLDAIAKHRSVQAASEHLGISYRSAWGWVTELTEAFGRPLVLKTKGHGSSLTEFGAEVLGTLSAVIERLDGPILEEARRAEAVLSRITGATAPHIRLSASHDPMLVSAMRSVGSVELTVVGSERALDNLRNGTATAAGFHFGAFPVNEGSFASIFRDPSIAVMPLFRREQGLMLAAGNPLQIRSIQDIAEQRCRFINRQKGSGTRIWFNQLLAAAGLKSGAIVGYDVEEFTHQAVAAVIASGAADVGMGARVAAEQFGLAFVPIGWETYYLAVPTSVPPMLETIIGPVREQVLRTPGYAPPDTA